MWCELMNEFMRNEAANGRKRFGAFGSLRGALVAFPFPLRRHFQTIKP
jgi:hypothetical protein